MYGFSWFLECLEHSFVNCWFASNGPCLNPRHRRSGRP